MSMLDASVTDFLADVLRTLPDATVTVTEAGVVTVKLSGGSAFFVRTAR